MVEELFKLGATDVSISGRNALSTAIWEAQDKVIEKLLRTKDVDPRIQDKMGRNSLLLALNWSDWHTARRLLSIPPTAKTHVEIQQIENDLLTQKDVFGFRAIDYAMSFTLLPPSRRCLHALFAKTVLNHNNTNGVYFPGNSLSYAGLSSLAHRYRQLNIEIETNAVRPVIYHRCVCNLCRRSIGGTRYVCETCPDYDLCAKCMKAYQSGQRGNLVCRGHNFREVELPHFEPEKLENFQMWLEEQKRQLSGALDAVLPAIIECLREEQDLEVRRSGPIMAYKLGHMKVNGIGLGVKDLWLSGSRLPSIDWWSDSISRWARIFGVDALDEKRECKQLFEAEDVDDIAMKIVIETPPPVGRPEAMLFGALRRFWGAKEQS